MAQNLSSLVGLNFGNKSIIIRPESMSADGTNIHTDSGNYGALPGVIQCVNFLHTGDGSIWFAAPWQTGWRDDQNIYIELTFGMNGASVGNVMVMRVDYWFLTEGLEEVNADPDSPHTGIAFNYTATTNNDNNQYSVSCYYPTNDSAWSADPKIASAAYQSAIPVDTIVVKLSRLASSGSDTFEGTLHLIKVRLFQDY